MTRRLANCVFVMLLVLSATVGTVAAQGRGRGGAGGPPARTAPAPAMARGGGGPAARPPATAAPPAYNRPNTGPASQFAVRRPQRQVIVTTPPYGYYGGYYGTGYYDPYPSYGWAPSYYGAAPYPSSYVEQSYVAPSSSQGEVDLSYQVERLTREVERLRQDQADAALRQSLQPPPPAPRAPEPPAIPITLVFRDGHRLSIQSYAVVRQTLWVVDERMSMRIDLSDLDLPATQQANLGRVLLLPVPAK